MRASREVATLHLELLCGLARFSENSPLAMPDRGWTEYSWCGAAGVRGAGAELSALNCPYGAQRRLSSIHGGGLARQDMASGRGF